MDKIEIEQIRLIARPLKNWKPYLRIDVRQRFCKHPEVKKSYRFPCVVETCVSCGEEWDKDVM